MKEIHKKFFSKEVLIVLLLFNTVLHYMNFRFEKVDLPNATKKLFVDTVKRELSAEFYCNKGSCKKEAKNFENVVDEISYASQLGRLDTISLLLTIFGLILGFGAVAGFMHIKESAERIAEVEAINYLKNNGPKIISEYLEKNLPAFIEKSEVQKNVQASDDKLEDSSLSEIIEHMDNKS